MLPADSSSHHTTPTRVNIWRLIDGFDPTMCTLEEIEAARSASSIHINTIISADDPDRFAFGLVDAFTKKVTGAMARMDFGPLTVKPDPSMRPNEIKMVQTEPVFPLGGPPDGPGEIDGLTPDECRDRWEANAAAIESGMARPYALSPDQIAEGKRLHVEARKAGR